MFLKLKKSYLRNLLTKGNIFCFFFLQKICIILSWSFLKFFFAGLATIFYFFFPVFLIRVIFYFALLNETNSVRKKVAKQNGCPI